MTSIILAINFFMATLMLQIKKLRFLLNHTFIRAFMKRLLFTKSVWMNKCKKEQYLHVLFIFIHFFNLASNSTANVFESRADTRYAWYAGPLPTRSAPNQSLTSIYFSPVEFFVLCHGRPRLAHRGFKDKNIKALRKFHWTAHQRLEDYYSAPLRLL